MLALAAQTAALCSVWLLWRCFRRYFVKSPLDNVPGLPRESVLYGNLEQILACHAWPLYDHLTDTYPGIVRLAGPLGARMLYVFDPVAMQSIVVKDQHIYEEAAFFVKSNMLYFGPGLLSTLGDHHRKQRKLLNPVFSTAHVRGMMPTFNDIAGNLLKGVENFVRAGRGGPVEIDIHDWMGRTALELIGQSGLGYSFDPLVSDSSDMCAQAIKAFQPTLMQQNFIRRIVPYLPEGGPPWLRRKLVELIPSDSVQQMRRILETISERAVQIYKEKKRMLEEGDEALESAVGEGKDLLSILLRANMTASQEDKLPDEELLAQLSTFVFAAMDTTSIALSTTLDLLADHPVVQEKLRKELLGASDGEDLDYDTLVTLPYLDAVCRKTLRLYPPKTTVFRETRQDTVLPLSQPITGVDGSQIREVLVPKDTTVLVGVHSSNRNKAIWGEDAQEWKPERWLDDLPESVTEAKVPGIYSNLMTFFGGNRACIGFKFSQLEMKVVLYKLLTRFTFTPSNKQIVWNQSGLRFPSVAGHAEPSLPLMVALYYGGSIATAQTGTA